MEPLSERLKTVIDDCVDSISPVQQEVVDRSVEVLESVEAILGSDYDLDRLLELVEDAGNRKFDPGQEVWVVEREDDEAVEVSGYVFVAQAGFAAIVSPYIGMSGDIEYILSEQIEQTAEGLSGDLQTYPISDCYQTKQAAEAALKGEQDATKV